jgi:hypothetical protein
MYKQGQAAQSALRTSQTALVPDNFFGTGTNVNDDAIIAGLSFTYRFRHGCDQVEVVLNQHKKFGT